MADLNGARVDPKTGDIYFTSIGPTVITQASVPNAATAHAYVTTPVYATPQLTNLNTITSGRNVTLTMLDANTVAINASGSVSQITAYGDDGVVVTGSPITSSGTMRFSLAATGVTPGMYANPNLSVDEKGRITLISNGTTVQQVAGQNFEGDGHLFAYTDGTTLVFRALSAGPGIAIADAGNAVVISATTSNAGGNGLLSVSNGVQTASVVTSLSFPDALLAVNGGLATLSFPRGVQSVALQGTADILTGNVPVTSSGTLSVSLSNTGVVAGTYTNATIRVDAKGRVLSASTGAGRPAPAPVVVENQGVSISSTLASLNFVGNAVVAAADMQGNVSVQVLSPAAYSFQINYDPSGNIASITGAPSGWTITVSGATLTVAHNLGAAAVPLHVSAYGFGGSFPGQFTQRVPVGTSAAAFSFTVNPGAGTFTLYNATYNNTSAAVGSYALIRVLV